MGVDSQRSNFYGPSLFSESKLEERKENCIVPER